MGVNATGGNGDIVGLWTIADKKKKDTIDETQKVPGLGVAFAPNGASFADTIKESFYSSGNNCAGI